MNRATSTLDFTNHEEVARVLPQAPLVASHHTGWQGLTFSHYCQPPHETVEPCLRQHSLVITDPKSCFRAERRVAGKWQHYAHGNGRVDVIPALLSYRTTWNQEVEFSVVSLCPALLHQATREQREVELMLQFAIAEPVS